MDDHWIHFLIEKTIGLDGLKKSNLSNMNKYIGTKQIEAKEMNLGDYNNYRGWTIPENEDPKRDGFLIKYEDGYESWSPKEVFEAAYRKTDGLTFGLAVEALKLGKKIQRAGWNGKGLFVFMQIPATIGEEIVPKMQSLPQSVKDEFIKRTGNITYANQMAIVNPDSSINGWVASSSDTFAEDWCILE